MKLRTAWAYKRGVYTLGLIYEVLQYFKRKNKRADVMK